MDVCGGTGECETPAILTVVTLVSSEVTEVLLVEPGDLGLITASALRTAFIICARA